MRCNYRKLQCGFYAADYPVPYIIYEIIAQRTLGELPLFRFRGDGVARSRNASRVSPDTFLAKEAKACRSPLRRITKNCGPSSARAIFFFSFFLMQYISYEKKIRVILEKLKKKTRNKKEIFFSNNSLQSISLDQHRYIEIRKKFHVYATKPNV
ncbi:hypothetical protein PUN28_016773 [Cardiocondyla obscurior]|uniref:Uncharacterized protein n=1 Tax=Cardiocondyla obscurior TaxID=286306 RepID=A0AAW2EPW8_9HYME